MFLVLENTILKFPDISKFSMTKETLFTLTNSEVFKLDNDLQIW